MWRYRELCAWVHKLMAFFRGGTCTTWVQAGSVQLLSHVRLFVTPWTAALQAFLSITNSRSLLRLMSVESVMPSSHLILCRPLLLPSIFPSIRVFSSESLLHIRWPKYWSFSEAWHAAVHGVAKSQTRLSDWTELWNLSSLTRDQIHSLLQRELKVLTTGQVPRLLF